jgi:cell division inhibitor SepF
MSFLDKFLNVVRLNEDFDDDDEFFDEEDPVSESEDPVPVEKKSRETVDSEPAAEKPRNRFFKKMNEEEPVRSASKIQKTEPKIRTVQSTKTPSRRKTAIRNDMEVSVIKPTTMENTREIADTLLSDCTVVLNLEGIDVELAQRIIDFACGTCYAIQGSLQKVSSYIFILTPSGVEISGDIQDILNGGIPAIRSDF